MSKVMEHNKEVKWQNYTKSYGQGLAPKEFFKLPTFSLSLGIILSPLNIIQQRLAIMSTYIGPETSK